MCHGNVAQGTHDRASRRCREFRERSRTSCPLGTTHYPARKLTRWKMELKYEVYEQYNSEGENVLIVEETCRLKARVGIWS